MSHLRPMTHLRLVAATLATLALGAFALGQTPGIPAPQSTTAPAPAPTKLYKQDAGPFTFRTIDEDWADTSRTPGRTIPVRMFIPDAKPAGADGTPAPQKFPVIVFSPGLGGSRINYAYFARHLASNGYIVIVPSHPGSDTAAALEWLRTHGEAPARRPIDRLRGRGAGEDNDPARDDRAGGWLMTSINDPVNLRERPRDISFILDHIAAHPILAPIADMSRIGVGGHSFGAYTAMAIGGMRVDLPKDFGGAKQSFRDKRVRAVLPMSPEGAGAMGILSNAWDTFDAPVLFLTGTRDYGAGGRSASWRRQAYEAIHGVDDFLFTLDGAGHMTFGRPEGLLSTGTNESESAHSAIIRSLGTAFFDAYILDDAAAKQWLQTYARSTPPGCTAEYKPAEQAAAPKPSTKH